LKKETVIHICLECLRIVENTDVGGRSAVPLICPTCQNHSPAFNSEVLNALETTLKHHPQTASKVILEVGDRGGNSPVESYGGKVRL
jgi:hypothetical protein